MERLLGARHLSDDDDPVAIGMALRVRRRRRPSRRGRPPAASPPSTSSSLARRIQQEAFGGDGDEVGRDQAESDFAREGVDGSTFLAFVDGEPVAAGYASYTPLGLILFGGATLPSARGRGAYRALVSARAREAAARGTPVVVTHAGRMSRPILERLGFQPVCRIDRLLDVFPA